MDPERGRRGQGNAFARRGGGSGPRGWARDLDPIHPFTFTFPLQFLMLELECDNKLTLWFQFSPPE